MNLEFEGLIIAVSVRFRMSRKPATGSRVLIHSQRYLTFETTMARKVAMRL